MPRIRFPLSRVQEVRAASPRGVGVTITIRVRDVPIPDGVERWRWETLLDEIGDLVIARSTGADLVPIVVDGVQVGVAAEPVFEFDPGVVGEVVSRLGGDADESWARDPEWWRG